jgi:hypothetical protein
VCVTGAIRDFSALRASSGLKQYRVADVRSSGPNRDDAHCARASVTAPAGAFGAVTLRRWRGSGRSISDCRRRRCQKRRLKASTPMVSAFLTFRAYGTDSDITRALLGCTCDLYTLHRACAAVRADLPFIRVHPLQSCLPALAPQLERCRDNGRSSSQFSGSPRRFRSSPLVVTRNLPAVQSNGSLMIL